jgi:hypothetical protein
MDKVNQRDHSSAVQCASRRRGKEEENDERKEPKERERGNID